MAAMAATTATTEADDEIGHGKYKLLRATTIVEGGAGITLIGDFFIKLGTLALVTDPIPASLVWFGFIHLPQPLPLTIGVGSWMLRRARLNRKAWVGKKL
jgi:hypothetical protein